MNIALNDTAHQAILVQLSGKKYPYSPWQNGKVKKGHREDGKILYSRKVFTSEKEFIKQVEKHGARYNSTANTTLDFKSPN